MKPPPKHRRKQQQRDPNKMLPRRLLNNEIENQKTHAEERDARLHGNAGLEESAAWNDSMAGRDERRNDEYAFYEKNGERDVEDDVCCFGPESACVEV